ncbi:MAG: hypothetical protein ACREN2_09840 [Candidatus Dormibacteria bacterium]
MSGSLLERGRLDDGTPVVIKHVAAARDWIMQATGDTGRISGLWAEGVFDRIPAGIDHTMLDVRAEPDGAVVVMRDRSAAMFTESSQLRAAHQSILHAAALIHRSLADAPRTQLCALADLYAFLSPQRCAAFAADHDVPREAVEGWTRLHDLVPVEISDAVQWVHADPGRLANPLLERHCAFVHGDMKMANMGAAGDTVVLVDWGTLTTWAPPAVEYAWYMAVNGAALDLPLDHVLDDVRQTDAGDDDVALRLALVGGLCQLGWAKALGATADDPATRQRERDGLEWWVAQTLKALDAWIP